MLCIGSLLLDKERQEQTERPQEKIMDINEDGKNTMIITTDVHIAHPSKEAISRAYKGILASINGYRENTTRTACSR